MKINLETFQVNNYKLITGKKRENFNSHIARKFSSLTTFDTRSEYIYALLPNIHLKI